MPQVVFPKHEPVRPKDDPEPVRRQQRKAQQASPGDGSHGLCSRCNDIDGDALLDTSIRIPEHGLHIVALGKPRSRSFRTTCPLCVLFLSVATDYKRHYDLELRLFDGLPGRNRSDSPGVPQVSNRFLAVVRRNERLVYDARIVHEIGSNGLLVMNPDDKEILRCVQPVDQSKVDYDMIAGWLDHCTRHHAACSHSSLNHHSDVQLHVIDCCDNTIKHLPHHEEYVALSYVWGITSTSTFTRFDAANVDDTAGLSLSATDVPRTIRDAMLVVRNIGRRYLWVDRYCIPHTDATRRMEAVLNMNQIYSGAIVTIVALHGDSAEAGLPGVSTMHRQSKQQVAILNSSLISSFPPLTTVIKNSTWSTRGWTFQEARLSRRCLFLTGQQAYYSCQVATVSEAMPDMTSKFPATQHLNSGGLDPSMFAPTNNTIFSGIFLDRLSYSQRTLTYQSDALDAFRGILRIHPFVTFWGVPVMRRGWSLDPLICFTMGLLWARRSLATFDAHMPDTITGLYERRSCFPTWSWLSLVGEVFQFGTKETCVYRQFFQNDVDAELEHPEPAFEVRLKDPGVELRDAVKLGSTGMLPENSRRIVIEGNLVRVRRKCNLSVRSGKVGHVRYRFCDENDEIMSDIYILPRIDLDEDDQDTSDAQDALILVDWRDGGRKAQRRFILMLLKWVDDGIAERVGLLGRYYEKWNVAFLDSLWKRRQTFELQ